MQPTSLPSTERKVLTYVSEATIKHKLNGLNDVFKNHHDFFFFLCTALKCERRFIVRTVCPPWIGEFICSVLVLKGGVWRVMEFTFH